MSQDITPLQQQLIEQIQHQGAIPFVDYMQQALYAPQLGYYRNGCQKFGEGGDFITAPELSPLFSYCVARQCAQLLPELGDQAIILEFGAGSGVMAADILLELERLDCLPAQYCLLEVSAELQQRQRQCIQAKAPHLFARCQWLTQLPQQFCGVVLANEVLDAMPVHQVVYQALQWQESYVDVKDQRLVWALGELSSLQLAAALADLPGEFTPGYQTEINLLLPGWVSAIAQSLTRGACLMIDYGFPAHEYYHPDRSMGTIMCHHQHKAHDDPLLLPGEQDITAHVDFTALAQAAVAQGLDVVGYTHQAAFLLNLEILAMAESAQDPAEQFALNNQIKRLTFPSEMGELFKVMGLAKNLDCAWSGFAQFDRRHQL